MKDQLPWPSIVQAPPQAQQAWSALSARLDELDPPPCSSAPDRWFSRSSTDVAVACKVCEMCAVRAQCEDYADAAGESFGVWAGVNRTRRSRLGRK